MAMNVSNTRLIIIWITFQVSAHLTFGFTSAKKPSAAFIFGDSLVDAGNSQYTDTIAKALPPNGIDFVTQPSYRFSNGRTISDCIEERLGRAFSPPYLSINISESDFSLKGVNYASSGSGVLSNTGNTWNGYFDLATQISYYEKTRQSIFSRIGLGAGTKLLRKALFLLVTGGNDVALDSVPTDLTAREAYLDNLTSQYKTQLSRLYNLDARKIVVASAGKIGCIPLERELLFGAPGCVAGTDEVVQSYNRKLKVMLVDLTASLEGAKYVYLNYYGVMEDIIDNYKSYGFENNNFACCHFIVGAHWGLIPCFPGSQVCEDRSKYVFWDTFHLSDAANVIAAKHVVDGGSKFISPMNIRQLVNL